MVQANLQTLSTEGLHIFLHQIPAEGGAGDLEVGVLGIKHAEAVVMLGGQNSILHAGGLGGAGPLTGGEVHPLVQFQ